MSIIKLNQESCHLLAAFIAYVSYDKHALESDILTDQIRVAFYDYNAGIINKLNQRFSEMNLQVDTDNQADVFNWVDSLKKEMVALMNSEVKE